MKQPRYRIKQKLKFPLNRKEELEQNKKSVSVILRKNLWHKAKLVMDMILRITRVQVINILSASVNTNIWWSSSEELGPVYKEGVYEDRVSIEDNNVFR